MKQFDFSITDNSDLFKAAKDEAVLKFLEEAGLHLEGQAVKALEMDPRRVDTGLLHNSIAHAVSGDTPHIGKEKGNTVYKSNPTHDKKVKPVSPIETGEYSGTVPEASSKSEMAVYVGSNVEYAEYVHEGTSKMAPNRFLKNAFELNKGQLKDKLEAALKNA